jgi:membrane protein DedA with SNARE-associated domain
VAFSKISLPPNVRLAILRILAILFVVVISIVIYSVRDQAEKLAYYGYPGIFLLVMLAYGTVILPAPGAVIVFTVGAVTHLHPVGIALAAGLGATIGELSGYLAGVGGRATIERSKTFVRFSGWLQKYGGWVILIMASFPNPLFDVVGMAAGVLKIPLRKFLLFCWIGETIKMFLLAYFGTQLHWLQ